MSAFLVGNGLGFFNTSLSLLGNSFGQASLGQAGERSYVNGYSGNLVVQQRDQLLVGLGVNAQLTRTYNSQGQLDGDNNDGWRTGVSYLKSVSGAANTAGSSLTKVNADGSETVYLYDVASGKYRSTDGRGAHDTIALSGDGTAIWYQDNDSGLHELYAADGRLLEQRDRDNNKTWFGYTNASDGTRLLTSVTNSSQVLHLNYNLSNKQLTSLSIDTLDSNGVAISQQTVAYGYDASGRLDRVSVDLTPENSSDAQFYETTYTYVDNTHQLASISQSDGTTVAFAYYADGKLRTVTDGNNNVTSYTYNLSNTVGNYTKVTDGLGHSSRFYYDGQGRLTRSESTAVDGKNYGTDYTYDASGNVTSITKYGRLSTSNAFLSADTTSFEYDVNGNLTLERDALGNTVTRTYTLKNQLATETLYLVADPDGAGAAQASEPQTSRYVYDLEGHLRFVINNDGEVTERLYDPSGTLAKEFAYTQNTFDVSSLGQDAVPALSGLESWSASLDKSGAVLTSYAVDFRGQITSSTIYETVSAAGAGNGGATTEYIYDHRGLLLHSISANGQATSDLNDYKTEYAYDGMGRVLSVTDAQGNTSTTSYHNGGQVVVSAPNGLLSTSQFDAAGRLLSTVATDANSAESFGTSNNYYDERGMMRASRDEFGAIDYIFYDAMGRVSHTVDATGSVVGLSYDKRGNVLQTNAYANRIDTTGWFNETSSAVTVSNTFPIAALTVDVSRDRVSSNNYDTAGRLQSVTGPEGTTTTYFYDGASRVIRTEISGIDGNRFTRTFYDEAGRVEGALDAEGYLIQSHYDEAGRVIKTTAYAKVTDAALHDSGSFVQLQASASNDILFTAKNIISRVIYDNQSRVIASIDGEGYLSETVYDLQGQVTSSIRYATKVADTNLDKSTLDEVRPTNDQKDQISSFTYDERGLVLTSTDYQGVVTSFRYDAQGQVIETSRGASDVRRAYTEYDAAGRVIGTVNGVGSDELGVNATAAAIKAKSMSHGNRFVYDSSGRMLQSIDANGNTTKYFYDQEGRQIFVVDAEGSLTETVYNAFGDVIKSVQYGNRFPTARHQAWTGGYIDPVSAQAVVDEIRDTSKDTVIEFNYNRRGQLLEVMRQVLDSIGTISNYKTSNSYSTWGEMKNSTQGIDFESVTNGRSTTTEYIYDKRGLATSVVSDKDGLAVTATTEYDAFGRVIKIWDAKGNLSQLSYDRLGRTVVTTDPTNATRSMAYDAFGRVLTQTDALGNQVGYEYSDSDKSVTTFFEEGVSTKSVTNEHGETMTVFDAKGNKSEFIYDKNGQLSKSIDALGNEIRSEYDNAGLVTNTYDALGNRTHFSYDATNRILSKSIDPDGLNIITAYTYDGKGQVLTVTDPNGTITQTDYDKLGQVERVTVDPNGLNLVTEYTYDGQGNQLTVTQAPGQNEERVTEYHYDNLGRLQTKINDPTGLALTENYAYDDNGNVIQSTNPNGAITRFAYDEKNQLRFTVDANNYVSENIYDIEGRLIETKRYDEQVSIIGNVNESNIIQALNWTTSEDFADLSSESVYLAAVNHPTGNYGLNHDAANGRIEFSRIDRTTSTWPAVRTLDTLNVDGKINLKYELTTGDASEQRYFYGGLDSNGSWANSDLFRHAINFNSGGQIYASAVEYSKGAGSKSFGAAKNNTTYVIEYEIEDNVSTVYVYEKGLTRAEGNSHSMEVKSDIWGDRTKIILYNNPRPGMTGTSVYLDNLSQSFESGFTSSKFVYDDLGRQQYAIDARGFVNENVYDANGNVVEIKRYENPLTNKTETGLEDLDNSAVSSSRYAYDQANRQIFAIDAEGHITKNEYDANGQVVAQHRYIDVNISDLDLSSSYNSATSDINAWEVYDATPAGATITRVFDAEASKDVIQLQGSGTNNGYKLRQSVNGTIANWNHTNKSLITFDMKYNQGFYFYISVDTDFGHRYIRLEHGNGDVAQSANKTYLFHKVGSDWHDGTWQTQSIDLNDFLHTLEPDNNIIDVNAFLVRGSGLFGDISLKTNLANASELAAAIDAYTGGKAANTSRTLYDKAGRAQFVIDAEGYFSENIFDANGQVIAVKNYEELYPFDETVNAETVKAALSSDFNIVEDFSVIPEANFVTTHVNNATYANAIRYENGRMIFAHEDLATAQWPSIYTREGINAQSASLTQFEVTTTDVSKPSYMFAGINDLGAEGGLNRYHVYFTGDRILAYYNDNGPSQSTQIGTSKSDTTYQVEFHVEAVQANLYVYEKGTNREDGFKHTLDYDPEEWGSVRFRAYANPRPGGSGSIVYLDNFEQSVKKSNLSQTIVDKAGRGVFSIDAKGYITQSIYDAVGNLTESRRYTEPATVTQGSTPAHVEALLIGKSYRSEKFFYDDLGRVIYNVDDLGFVIENVYDAQGRVSDVYEYANAYTSTTAADQTTLVAAYNKAALSANDRHTHTDYDANGNAILIRDALGQTEIYSYDSYNQAVSFTNKKGDTWSYAYDKSGNLTHEVSPQDTFHLYDTSGDLASTKTRLVTRMEYDYMGNVIARTEAHGENFSRTTRYGYDALGRQNHVEHPKVGSDSFVADTWFDSQGNAVVNKDVQGNYSYKAYDSLNRERFSVDAEGYVTEYKYDAFGNQIELKRYANRLPGFVSQGINSYSESALETAVANMASAQDRNIIHIYDNNNRRIETREAAIEVYDVESGLSYTSTPTTRYEYNAFGELNKTSRLIQDAQSGRGELWADSYNYFDDLGRKTHEIDAQGYLTAYTYNAFDKVETQIEYALAIDTASLNVNTNPVPKLAVAGDEKFGLDRAVTFEYDKLGQLRFQHRESVIYHNYDGTESSPVRLTSENVYDAVGNMVKTIQNGITVNEKTYNKLGSQIAVKGTATSVLANSNVGSGINANNLNTVAVAADNTAFTTTSSHAYSSFKLDVFGNVLESRDFINGYTGTSVPEESLDDRVATYQYDEHGRVVNETNPEGHLTRYTYDKSGNILTTEKDYKDSKQTTDFVARTIYEYDKSGRQTVTEIELGSNNQLASSATDNQVVAVVYNAFGEIIAKGDHRAGGVSDTDYINSLQEQFVYDNAGRLIEEKNIEYAYNKITKQVEQTAVIVAKQYAYNEQGLSAKEYQRASGEVFHYYDKLGREIKSQYQSIEQNYKNAAEPTTLAPSTTKEVDRWGNVLTFIDMRGQVSYIRYNQNNQVVFQQAPTVNVAGTDVHPTSKLGYDKFGRQIFETDARGNTRYKYYNDLGQVTSEQNALGYKTHYAFDVLGRQVAKQAANGYVTTQSFDKLDQVLTIGDIRKDSNGQWLNQVLSNITYNALGNKVSTQQALSLNANGTINWGTSYIDYDVRGNTVREENAVGNVKTHLFSSNGHKVETKNGLSTTNSNIHKLSWSYDYFGRIHHYNDLGDRDYVHVYDTNGQLTFRGYSHQVVIIETEPGFTFRNEYEETVGIHYDYYADGKIKSVDDYNTNRHAKYEYDEQGQRTYEHVKGQTKVGSTYENYEQKTMTEYDAHGRMGHIVVDDVIKGEVTLDARYFYDEVGNRLKVRVADSYSSDLIEEFNYAPTVNKTIDPVSLEELSSTVVNIGTDLFTDLNIGDTLAYSAQLEYGAYDGDAYNSFNTADLPSWMVFDPSTVKLNINEVPIGQSSFTASGEGNGVFRVRITATDPAGATASTYFTVTVDPYKNKRPTVDAGVSTIAVDEQSVINQVINADAFADVEGDTLSYTAYLLTEETHREWDPEHNKWIVWTAIVENDLPSWLQLSTGGVFSGNAPTLANHEDTSYRLRIRATEVGTSELYFTQNDFDFIVRGINVAPEVDLGLGGQKYAEIGSPFSYVIPANAFSDGNNDNLTYLVAGKPSWMTFNATTRAFGGTPPLGSDGLFTITVTARDPLGLTVSTTFKVRVNSKPTASGTLPNLSYQAQRSLSFNVRAPFADADGNALTYEATLWNGSSYVAIPSWLNFNPSNGVFSANPPSNSVSNYTISIRATDGHSISNRKNFSLNITPFVNQAPTGGTIADQIVNEGSAYSYTVPSNLFNDSDGHSLTYAAYQVIPGHYETQTVIDEEGYPMPTQVWVPEAQIALPSWLSFNASTRVVSGSRSGISLNQNTIIRIKATEVGTSPALSVNSDYTLTVLAANDAPVVNVNPANSYYAEIGSAFVLDLPQNTFVDPNNDNLTYTVTNKPSWLTFTASSLKLTGTPTASHAGNYNITLTANDNRGGSVSTVISVIVDSAPVVSLIPNKSYQATRSMSFNVGSYFSDANGDALTFTAKQKVTTTLYDPEHNTYETLTSYQNLPSWLSFNTTTGLLTGTPPTSEVGKVLTLRITGSDGNNSVNDEFNLSVLAYVNQGPYVSTPLSNQSVQETSSKTYTFASTAFRDNDGHSLTYAANLSNGSSLPSWIAFNASTRTFTLSPAYGHKGAHDVRVTANDGHGGTVSDIFRINVSAGPNRAPYVNAAIPNASVQEGASKSHTFSATAFRDSDGDPLTYTASLSNNNPLPSWITFNASTRTFTFNPAYGNQGAYDLKVTANDGNGATVYDVFRLTVSQGANRAPVVSAGIPNISGQRTVALNYTFPSNAFSDPDGNSLTYIAQYFTPQTQSIVGWDNYGEPILQTIPAHWTNTLPAWLNFSASTRKFTGTPPNNTASTIQMRVLARDPSGLQAIDTFNINLSAAPNRAPVVANAIPNKSIYKGQAWSYAFPTSTFSDPDGNALSYSAKQSNNSSLPSWLSFNTSTRTFSGTPPSNGTWYIKVTANDGQGATVTDTFTLTVTTQPNAAPYVANPLPNRTMFQYDNDLWVVASNAFIDPNGDPLTYSASLSNGAALPGFINFNPSNRLFNANPIGQGSYDIRVTASDGKGGSVSDIFRLTIRRRLGGGGDPLPFSLQSPLSKADVSETQTVTPPPLSSEALTTLNDSRLNEALVTKKLDMSRNDKRTMLKTIRVANKQKSAQAPLQMKLSQASIDETAANMQVNALSQSQPIEQAANVFSTASVLNPIEPIIDPDGEPPTFDPGDVNYDNTVVGNIREYSFSYDAENRITGSQNYKLQSSGTGYVQAAGTLTRQWIEYDEVGNQVLKASQSNNSTYNAQKFDYDLQGRVVAIYSALDANSTDWSNQADRVTALADNARWELDVEKVYDVAGRVIENREYTKTQNFVNVKFGSNNYTADSGKQLKKQTLNYYRADGNLVSSEIRGLTKGTYQSLLSTVYYNEDLGPNGNWTPLFNQVLSNYNAEENFSLLNKVNYAGTNLGYDSTGKIKGYQLIKYRSGLSDTESVSSYTHTYKYTYKNFDSYRESKVAGTSSHAHYKPGTSLSYYDLHGNRTSVTESYDIDGYKKYQARFFAYNLDGHIIRKDTGEFEGQSYSPTHEIEDENGSQVNNWAITTQEHGTTHYYYANGKQLGQIDGFGRIDFADMGYQTIGRNVSTSDAAYTANQGDTLRSVAQLFYGNSDLWYVIADANGLTSGDERLVQGLSIKVPGQVNSYNNSETFKTYNPAEIVGDTSPAIPYVAPPPKESCGALIIIIMVVVAVVTAGVGTAVTGALGGGFWAGVAGGAVGAAAGSVVGQGLKIATGLQDGFSWKEVGAAALTGAITGGIGGAGDGAVGKWLDNNQFVNGALNNTVSQAVNVSVGLQEKFEWKQVAVAAVASYVSDKAGETLGLDSINENIVKTPSLKLSARELFTRAAANFAGDVIGEHLKVVLYKEGKVDYGRVAANSFGNAFGSSLSSRVSSEIKAKAKADLIARIIEEANSHKVKNANKANKFVPVSYQPEEPSNEVYGNTLTDRELEQYSEKSDEYLIRGQALASIGERLLDDPEYAREIMSQLNEQGRKHEAADLLYDFYELSDGSVDTFTNFIFAGARFSSQLGQFALAGIGSSEETMFNSEQFKSELNILGVSLFKQGSVSVNSDAILFDAIGDLDLLDNETLIGFDGILRGTGDNRLERFTEKLGAYIEDRPMAAAIGVLSQHKVADLVINGGGGAADFIATISDIQDIDPKLGFEASMPILEKAINAGVKVSESLENLLGKKVFKRRKSGNKELVQRGSVGEYITQLIFEHSGLFQEVHSMQNRQDNGIDIIGKTLKGDGGPNGQWIGFEVKTTKRKYPLTLSRAGDPSQRDGGLEFVMDRLERQINKRGEYKSISDKQAELAEKMYTEIKRQKEFNSYVVHITKYHNKGQDVQFRKWSPNSPSGVKIKYPQFT